MPLTKSIFTQADVVQFEKSPVYQELLGFVQALGASVEGKPNSHDCGDSVPVAQITNFLHQLYGLVDEVPPLQQKMRFGNKAFVTWHARMVELAGPVLDTLLASDQGGHTEEVAAYLFGSFGSTVRLDYGTGHETSFVAFLYCLKKLEVLSEDDLPALGLKAFNIYMQVLRRLQKDYMLEPAGSHGVWGLDDYQCLAFYFGASQLIRHQSIEPASIHDESVLKDEASEYQYLACVKFIKEVKKGIPFQETSPMLSDISQVPSWKTVFDGMLRLYQGEVLRKLPVIQHFHFGELLKATWTPSMASPEALGAADS
jgi:hypothetical protein